MAKNVLFIGGPWHKEQRMIRDSNLPIQVPVLPENEVMPLLPGAPAKPEEMKIVRYVKIADFDDSFIQKIYAPDSMPQSLVLPILADVTIDAMKESARHKFETERKQKRLTGAIEEAIKALDLALADVDYYDGRNARDFMTETREKLNQLIFNSAAPEPGSDNDV